MEIRLLKKDDDRYSISRVYEESWKYAYKGIIPKSFLDSIKKGKWAKTIDNPKMHSLIMLDEDEIIGTVSYCSSRFSEMSNYGEIVSIYLLPDYIGKGYGKVLLKAAINKLVGMGFSDIFLWVLEENKNARHFYEKFVFKLSGRYLNDSIGGKALREIQYVYHIIK